MAMKDWKKVNYKDLDAGITVASWKNTKKHEQLYINRVVRIGSAYGAIYDYSVTVNRRPSAFEYDYHPTELGTYKDEKKAYAVSKKYMSG